METKRTDTELVEAWQRGDAAALGAVYDRYGGAIHGFALARTGSAADAADVVPDTFVRAATRVHQLREPERLRAWLFAIARRRVYDLSGRRDVVSGRAYDDRPADDAPLETSLVRTEVHELVWAAAGSLNERDRELLELHLRDGLEGADLAAVVGLAPSHVHTLVNRLRERMAKAVGALLVARHARRACPALDGVLAGWDGKFTLDVRSRVTRHVEACAVCTAERGNLLVPGWFTAGALAIPVALPPELRDRVLAAARQATAAPRGGADDDRVGRADRQRAAADRHGDRWRHDGFPVPPRPLRHRGGGAGRWARVAGVVAGLAVVVTSVVLLTGRSEGEQAVVEAPATGVAPESTGPVETSMADTAEEGTASVPMTTGVAIPVAVATSTTPATAPAQGADRQGTPTSDGGLAVDEGRPAPPTVAGATTVPPTALPTGVPGSSGGAPPVAAGEEGGGGAPPSGGDPGAGAGTGSTSPPTAPTTTVPPAAPASLQLSTTSLSLGPSSSSASFTVTNQGGQPATLSTTSSSSTLAVGNGGATVAPGAAVTLTVTLDRAAEAEGSRTFVVTVGAPGASGGGQVVVTATVERAPVITSLSRTPATIRTSTSCGQTLTRVTVDATDESGIASVSVLWSSDGVFGQRTSLSLDGSGHWTAQVGSFSVTGTRSLTVEVVDTRGNHVNGSTSVTVVAC